METAGMAREDQKMRSEQVRQAILDTALKMGMGEGFDELSIRKIIKEMNYSTGIIYYHFKDKQEIIDAIEEKETEWLKNKIMGIIQPEMDILLEMEKVFHMIMRLAVEEPEKYNLIVLQKYSRRKPAKPGWILYLASRLEKVMEEGRIRKMDSEKMAFSIWSSFLGFNLMLSRYPDLAPDEAEKMFRIQFDILLRGVLVNE
jgi:AcrR family transcriptional regulator